MPFLAPLPFAQRKPPSFSSQKLGSNSLQHFEATKRLRSIELSYPALCARHRLAKHLPAYMAPPAKSRVKCFAFRGFTAPKFYKPLRIPYLAQAKYKDELRSCMRASITMSIKAVTPFHVPMSSLAWFARGIVG